MHNGSSVIYSYNVYMKNNPQIDFYCTGTVHTILKRYEFNDNEKKIIQDAILAAKRDIPNMKAIQKADALLKMVASSREPIEQEESIDHKGIAKAVAQTNMKKYKTPQSAWTAPLESNSSSYSFAYSILAGVIIAGIISYSMKHQDRYTMDEASQICKEKNEVLPLTIDDFMDSSYKFSRPSLFWLANGKVIMAKTWEEEVATNDAEYNFICVPENGHKGEYADMYLKMRY